MLDLGGDRGLAHPSATAGKAVGRRWQQATIKKITVLL